MSDVQNKLTIAVGTNEILMMLITVRLTPHVIFLFIRNNPHRYYVLCIFLATSISRTFVILALAMRYVVVITLIGINSGFH